MSDHPFNLLNQLCSDFKDELLKGLLNEIITNKYDPYLTSVGGSGLGILSPYAEHRTKMSSPVAVPGQVTPPHSPSPETKDVTDLRPTFEMKEVDGLSHWAESLGRWLYV